ncbi:MAG: proprotein convertase P-domain-containing protein [Fimbriimonadia bacterium]|nr:proprotein convertase P-domain-containing protein [Fimbriimonadia bacterium]
MRRTLFMSAILATALAASVNAQSFTHDPANIPIPDSNPAGVNIPFAVAGLAGGVIEVHVHFSPSHTWVGDLIMRLTDPNGVTVTLIDRPRFPELTFGSNSDFLNARFQSTGTDPETHGGNFNSTGLGTIFRAHLGSIDDFNADVNGNWNLFISDNEGGDTGSFDKITITTPEPASMLALGAGLAGVALRRRKK